MSILEKACGKIICAASASREKSVKSEFKRSRSKLPRRSGRFPKSCPESNDDRETPSDSEGSLNSDSQSAPRGPEDMKKACKKIFTSTEFRKGKSAKSKLKQCPKLLRGTGRVPYCHSCRHYRKHFVQCSRCVLAFCDPCLRTRHGENAHEESEPGLQWVCPKCRGGCGPGCEKNCCNCSKCRRSQGMQPWDRLAAKDIRKQSQSAGFDSLHDYLIHLKTTESIEEIQNRKGSRGWTKAGGSNATSNANNVKNRHRSPVEHKAQEKKKRNVRRINESVSSICPERTVTKSACPKKVQRRGQKEDFSCRSDELGHPSKKSRQTATCEIDREKFLQRDQLGRSTSEINIDSQEKLHQGSSTDNEFYVDITLSKTFNDSLVPFGDMAMNVYLLKLWFRKDKDFIGKRMSMTLSDKEVKLRDAIKARSQAKAIAYQFQPTTERGRFLDRPRYQQEDMKNRLKDFMLSKELEESKMHLQQVCEEIDLMITEYLPRAKRSIDLAMKRLTEAVEMAVDAIQRDPENLKGSTLPNINAVVVMKLVDSILWDDSDRSTNENFDIGTTRKALRAELDLLGGLAVSVHLARQWFSREKDWSKNRMLITLNDEELYVKNMLRGILYEISLAIHRCGEGQDSMEHFKVNLRNALSEYSIEIEVVLQEIDVMITKALPEVNRNGDLALGNVTEAVQKAVDAIGPCRKVLDSDSQ